MTRTAINILFFGLLCGLVQAAEVGGISIDDKVQPGGGGATLVLNGAGVREKFFMDIYVGALYLPAKSASAAEILTGPGPKRVAMHFLYKEVDKEKLIDGWNEGFENNQSTADLDKFSERLNAFNALFQTVHAGDVIVLDYIPGTGTSVAINGVKKGTIPGEDFNRALLSVWLGDKPADDGLKGAMLGE